MRPGLRWSARRGAVLVLMPAAACNPQLPCAPPPGPMLLLPRGGGQHKWVDIPLPLLSDRRSPALLALLPSLSLLSLYPFFPPSAAALAVRPGPS